MASADGCSAVDRRDFTWREVPFMRPPYVRLMDKLYWLCVAIGIVSIVCMTCLIFIGVIMRYVFFVGASFAEPMSIFFAVQLTLYGAAACYRAQAHLSLQFFVQQLPQAPQRVISVAVHALMALIALAMIYFGTNLAQITWFQSYPEFIYIRVGFVYSAIPGGGLALLLFVIESFFYPGTMISEEEEEIHRALIHADEESRRLGL
jgi:TRAP-type transport system small permease protein